MVTYCIRDVEVTEVLWKYLSKRYGDEWHDALDLEHFIACTCRDMTQTGFSFDYAKAKELQDSIIEKIKVLDKEITDAFEDKVVLVRQIAPSATKFGTLHKKDFKWLRADSNGGLDLTPYSAGCPFSLIDYQVFNPGSVKQIVERLNAAGWKPTEKTKGHLQTERELKTCRDKTRRAELTQKLEEYRKTGWAVSEENLATVSDTAPPAAKKLAERLLLDRRRSTLEEWTTCYNGGTQRIHGTFIHIGSWTQRLAHQHPNTANIVSERNLYGHEMRAFWKAAPGKCLVDVDADGIQLRVLAHYMDDPRFTDALVAGRKEDGTDAHSLNKQALGSVCRSRAVAKTFIYSWLLGAGADKTAEVLGCSRSAAIEARDRFTDFYPGLIELKEEKIPFDAARGFFVGLDGRKVLCDSEHKMLSGYLQNGESIIMKKGLQILRDIATVPYTLVDFVHDEYVFEVEDDEEVAMSILLSSCEAIKLAGEHYKLRCPMKGSGFRDDGTPNIGYNWSEVH